MSVLGGAPGPLRLAQAALAVACALLVAASLGCGGGGGVAEGATVTAYVAAPLCAAAKQELASAGWARRGASGAGCLPARRPRGEASSTWRRSAPTLGEPPRTRPRSAYLEAPDPAASRFAHPILETAEIASDLCDAPAQPRWRACSSAIEAADSGSAAAPRN